MGNGDFRRRCEAALTHPATLIALAALLANDVVLKALFPGAWAMGKLSDLAWMSFAPPLLAFLLSFAVPKSAAGRRAALGVTYGGLPMLYAAFNTFAPVHDAIIRALLIGTDGGAVGSPMDATDSLVIPFGITLAIWAWRRSATSEGGGRRWRFGLLVAGIAAFASVASSPDIILTHRGVSALGAMDDGTLVAFDAMYGSDDGGMSWSHNNSDRYKENAVYTSRSVETPRGEYIMTGSGVERVGEDGLRELVYSTEYLRGDANNWLQEMATRNLGDRVLTTTALAIIYHPESGNLIVPMGIQGVAVGTTDGRWHRVAVGPYSPTDFSFSGKMRALAEQAWRIGAIAVALSISALTVAAAASAYEPKDTRIQRGKDIAFIIGTALCCLAAVGLIFSDAGIIVALVVMLTSWIAATIATLTDGGAQWKFALLACASTLTLSVAALFIFGISDTESGGGIPVTFPGGGILAAFLGFIALTPFIFPLMYSARFIARRWRAFGLAFLGMNALIALAFVVWLTLNLSLPATQVAIAVLVGLAAVVLVRHVRGADAGGWR